MSVITPLTRSLLLTPATDAARFQGVTHVCALVSALSRRRCPVPRVLRARSTSRDQHGKQLRQPRQPVAAGLAERPFCGACCAVQTSPSHGLTGPSEASGLAQPARLAELRAAHSASRPSAADTRCRAERRQCDFVGLGSVARRSEAAAAGAGCLWASLHCESLGTGMQSTG